VFGPEKFGAHLICGMGESERELLNACQKIRDMGGHNHLFAFFPERGSLMEDWPACDTAQWRRAQLARYIIDYGGGNIGRMRFDVQGRLKDYGLPQAEVERLIQSGKPFRTSGCPGKEEDISACNRPYGDSKPSAILSYPFALEEDDLDLVRLQIQQ
jgi:biotin synthase